jgi:hypothetical protein
MTVLDTNVVAVVLPTIARDLGASFAEVEWVVKPCSPNQGMWRPKPRRRSDQPP